MEEEKVFNFFRFEDLRIYHKALDYAIWVKTLAMEFPEHELRGLAHSYTRAAQSIPVSIAEGSGRNKGQFVFCLKTAKCAVRECVVLTTLAKYYGYIDDAQEEHSRNELVEMTKMMGALITSLQRNAKGNEMIDHKQEDFDDFNSSH